MLGHWWWRRVLTTNCGLVGPRAVGHVVLLLLAVTTFGLPAAQKDKNKALCTAARSGNSSGVLALLYAGAQPDGYVDDADEGATALITASKGSHSDIVRMLLDPQAACGVACGGILKAADPNRQDEDGWTALMWAARGNNGAEIAQLLLERGAKPNLLDLNRQTAWDGVVDPSVKDLLRKHGAKSGKKVMKKK